MNALLRAQQRRPRTGLTRVSGALGMNMLQLIGRPSYYINTALGGGYPLTIGRAYAQPRVSVPLDAAGNPLGDFNFVLRRQDTYSGAPRSQKCRCVGWVDSIATVDTSRYSATNKAYDAPTNVTTWDVVDAGGVYAADNPTLVFTGTRRTGGSAGAANTGIIGLEICAYGYTHADLAAGKVWTDDAVAFTSQFSVARYMDAQPQAGQPDLPSVIGDQQTVWAGAARTTFQGHSFGDLLALSNAAGVPPWFCIGLLWSDQAVKDFATWLDANLSPSLWAAVEYGNEIPWGFGFGSVEALRRTCIEVKGFVGGQAARWLTYGRTSNVMTVTTSDDHGWTAGQLAYFNNIGGLAGGQTVQSTPTSRTATFASAGADAAAGTSPGSGGWIVYAAGSILQADGNTNVYEMRRRWVDRRRKEVSDLVRVAVGDAKMNTRMRMVYADQMNNDTGSLSVGLDWIAATYPQRALGQKLAGSSGAYFWAWAGAPYYFSTLNSSGATVAQVAADLLAVAQNLKYPCNFERRVGEAAIRGMESIWYEGGPDTYSTNNLPGADRQVRAAAQYDPAAGQALAQILTDHLSCGGTFPVWYANGINTPAEDTGDGQYPWVHWARSNADTSQSSPKAAAAASLRANGVRITRNPLPTAIGESVTFPVNTSDRQYGQAIGALGWTDLRYILNALVDGTYSISYLYSCTSARTVQLYSGLPAVGQPLALAVDANHSTPHVSPTYSLGLLKKGPWMARLHTVEYVDPGSQIINYRSIRVTRTA